MPIVCIQRENRTKRRFWTARKVGEVACITLRSGVPLAEIEAEIAKCTERKPRDRPDDAAEAFAVAEQALSQSNEVFDADAASLQRFLALPLMTAAALRLIRFIPVVGVPLAVALPVLRHLATERVGQIAVQKAANDAAIAIVRRAAANAARFRSTGT